MLEIIKLIYLGQIESSCFLFLMLNQLLTKTYLYQEKTCLLMFMSYERLLCFLILFLLCLLFCATWRASNTRAFSALIAFRDISCGSFVFAF